MATSEAQLRATKRYLKTLTEIRFRVKKEDAERIKAAAEKREMSVRAFILAAIKKYTSEEN